MNRDGTLKLQRPRPCSSVSSGSSYLWTARQTHMKMYTVKYISNDYRLRLPQLYKSATTLVDSPNREFEPLSICTKLCTWTFKRRSHRTAGSTNVHFGEHFRRIPTPKNQNYQSAAHAARWMRLQPPSLSPPIICQRRPFVPDYHFLLALRR